MTSQHPWLKTIIIEQLRKLEFCILKLLGRKTHPFDISHIKCLLITSAAVSDVTLFCFSQDRQWFSLTSFKNNHQKSSLPHQKLVLYFTKQNKVFFNSIKYSGHYDEQSAFNIFKIFLNGISGLFPSSNLFASSTRIPNFPVFLHLSDLDCLILSE